jgi:hypothetical protein
VRSYCLHVADVVSIFTESHNFRQYCTKTRDHGKIWANTLGDVYEHPYNYDPAVSPLKKAMQ